MNSEIFSKIQARLEARISKCELFLYGIDTTKDLMKLSIERARALLQFCKEEEAVMTKFAQCDLYHIIGMGNLTPPQMSKFTYLVRDYLKYRSTIKTIAMNFDKISQLPGLPVSAAYKLKTWDDIILVSGLETVPEDSTLPYALSGNMILVLAPQLSEFIAFWSAKAKVNLTENNFQQKLKAGAEYGGVRWTEDSTGNYVGIIKQENARLLFEGCMQKCTGNICKIS